MNSTKTSANNYRRNTGSTALPPDVEQIAPDIVQIVRSDRSRFGFGLAFLVCGMVMLLAGAGLIPLDNLNHVDQIPHSVLLVIGLVFAVVGGGIAFGRTWITLDRGRGELIKASGLGVPLRTTKESLRRFTTVVLYFEPGDSDSAESWPVTLAAGDNDRTWIYRAGSFAGGHDIAAYVARFLNIPLEDRTTGSTRRYTPDEAALPVHERFDDDWRNKPARPSSMRSTVEKRNGILNVTVPHQTLNRRHLFTLIGPVAAGIFLLLNMHSMLDLPDTPEVARYISYGIILLLVVIVPAATLMTGMLRAKLGYNRLVVTTDQLSIINRGIIRKKSRVIKLADIIDIDHQTTTSQRERILDNARRPINHKYSHPGATVPNPAVMRLVAWVTQFIPSKGIVIKSRNGIDSFGATLPHDEAAYLCHTVRQWLASRH